ncbi:MAG: GHKL domain-containing protein [Spirochaetes bacterium]|nr:GHKL domain-containing protein [Spirochaetota bacterium]
MIKLSLKTILTFSFAIAGMIAIFILIFLTNFYLKKYFREYSILKQEDRNQKIVSLITSQYQKDTLWNISTIQDIGISLLEEGLIIKVTDNTGKIVWDAMKYNSGICEKMIENIKTRMDSKYPSLQGNFLNKEYFLNFDKKAIGNLQIGYYAPFFYTESEFFFIDALNNLIVVITVTTLVISVLIGYFMSRSLSIPIGNVITTTGKISNGLYSIRIEKKTIIKEVQELINSINNLALNLDSQETLRKQLSSNVSHELKTPLTTLQSHIEALIDGVWEPTLERLNSFHEEILRINNLVKDITNLSNYEHEKLKLNKSEIKLNKLINNLLLIYEAQFKSKNIAISFTQHELTASADKDKISQVIINLLANAVKFTPNNGYFNISLSKRKGLIKLIFTNSCEKIPEEDMPFLFERFYRVDKSRTRASGGAGIGLSIVKEIILAHNGNIEAINNDNQISFIITLPF